MLREKNWSGKLIFNTPQKKLEHQKILETLFLPKKEEKNEHQLLLQTLLEPRHSANRHKAK
jgi:hypothetical protein